MPHKIWAVGEEVLAADFNSYLQNQTVPQFPNVAARDTWAAPPTGALSVTTDTLTLCMYTGAAWRTVPARGRASATSDATGYVTITHGLGVIPTVIIATPGGPVTGANIVTATVVDHAASTASTFRLRLFKTDGQVLVSAAATVDWSCYP